MGGSQSRAAQFHRFEYVVHKVPAKHSPPVRERAPLEGVRVGALLSLRGVGKSYWRGDTEVRVLRDVTLDVRAGELTAVWGTRGSGKSTLLKLAARLEVPDSGCVFFNGVDLASVSERQHARLMSEWIGWVRRAGPQSDLRMLDYVALPLLGRAWSPPRVHARRGGAGAGRALGAGAPAVGQPVRRRAGTDRDRSWDRASAAAVAGGRSDRQPRRDRARAGDGASALARGRGSDARC